MTFIAVNTYFKKKKNLNNLSFYCKKVEKEKQTKFIASRKKEMIEIGAEVKEKEKHYRSLNETKS